MATYWKTEDLNPSETEKDLIKQLKEAGPDTRLKVAVNLTKAGHGDIVACIPGLQDAVRAAMAQENNLSFDATRTAAVPIGALDMKGGRI
jgi:hypothetical protein